MKWMAPEVLSHAPYTAKADVYSFSLIIWEVLVNHPFYEDYSFNSQIEIQVVNHDMRPTIPHNFSKKLRDLMKSAWSPDPKERPTCAELTNQLSSLTEIDVDSLPTIQAIGISTTA